MKKIISLLLLLVMAKASQSQTPVPMASQAGLTYTEDFADIANWADNFVSGIGANHWGAVAVNATGTIPDGVKTTVSTAIFQTTSTSGGVQRGGLAGSNNPAGTIVLLSTGTTASTTACAIDLYLNFSGVNAGTISFDWTQVNNSTGNRGGSVRVYSSIDGTTFSEITAAAVNNVINNTNASGSITSVALPSSFNGVSTARLRFYYFNGTTNGTTGNRPKISIDNLTVTAIANTPCTTPAAQPTALTFSTITDISIAGNFTAASPAANQYLTVISNNSSLTSYPVDGTVYAVGDPLGDGTVVAIDNTLGFTAAGLSPSTTYYFFIFSVKSACTGGPKYLINNPLIGNTTTNAGVPPCTAPASQPTALSFSSTGVNSMQGSFTGTTANEYLVVRSATTPLSSNPVNGVIYNPGDIIGGGTVVQRNNATNFTAGSLSPNTTYYFFIFSLNSQSCTNGPVYNLITPLTGSNTTLSLSPCVTPVSQPFSLNFNTAINSISGTFTAGAGADDYLTVRSLFPALSATPVDNTDYSVGTGLGGGTVIANDASTSFVTTGLAAGTTYYFFVFAANKNCSGGTKYLVTSPLTANATTTNGSANNVYFGNIHSHSHYSDGNQDNSTYTPADDYTYAMSSQCMDYLGISEHNHYLAGTLRSNYHLGTAQANSFTLAHPNFIALYGMEWGVISGGGHVVVYGDGMDNLFGWESNVGGVSGNNYDTYVAKNDYTGAAGLFKTINDNIGTNTFASLAHPNSGDYNNLANVAYNSVADNAITATAVESGPATSTNNTYSNPGSPMSYLWYYQGLLAKGYHLGPGIDHDNHNTTFGRTTYSRTGIIAPSLSKTAIINAYRNMHFYATQDCDTKVDFTINTKIMGSIVTDRYAPILSVSLTDATNSTSSAVINVMYGVPGSGVLPAQIYSSTGSTLNYTATNLANNNTGYYYLDITNGSSRIITAPIWYTRNDLAVLPIKLGAFLVKKLNNSVQLNWSTAQEINSSHFIIERSADGRNWNTIETVRAAGNSNASINYLAYDNTPLNGTNYYRLKLVDLDTRAEYSPVRNVYFNMPYTVVIAPNPVRDLINITIAKATSQSIIVEVVDISGKMVYEETTNRSSIQINLSGLAKGMYFVKLITEEGTITKKVLVQ